jgi:hypothetical protein
MIAGYSIARFRDDLVRVHVGLGLTPRLPNAQREMVVKLAGR